MSASDGSARTLFADEISDRNSCEEAAWRVHVGGRLLVRVRNTFISLEESSSPLMLRSKTEPNTSRGPESLSSPVDASGRPGFFIDHFEPSESEEWQARTPVSPTPFCSTPAPGAPTDPGPFFRAPAPEPAWPTLPDRTPASAQPLCQPAPQPALVQPPPLPTIRLQAAHAGAWPGPPTEPAASEFSGTPQECMRRRGGGARQPARGWRPPSVPTVPLQSQLCSTVDGYARIRWTVDARKLKGSDKQLVSPPLNVDLGMRSGPAVFKVMLTASGGSTFKKSEGFGCVQVKCVSEPDDDACTNVRVFIGSEDRAQLPRGPLRHCFSSNPVFTLPKELAEWNFYSAAEQQSNAMVVNVDIAPLV